MQTSLTTTDGPLGQTIAERLWLWGHPEGSCNSYTGATRQRSHSPAQGARYLGVRNIFYVPFGHPMEINACASDQEAIAQTGLSMEAWGEPGVDHLEKTLGLAPLFPNLDRVIIDDFFNGGISHSRRWNQMSVAQLQEVKERVNAAGYPFWVVLYQTQLEMPIKEHLDVFDGVSFWFWDEPTKEGYERYSKSFLEMTPGKRRLIGCYLYNFGLKQPATAELVRYQMDRNRERMQAGEIEGMVLHNNDLQGLGFEAYEAAREWITAHGGERICR